MDKGGIALFFPVRDGGSSVADLTDIQVGVVDFIVGILALAVLGLTLAAAVWDIRSLRIPNWISLVIAALFLVALIAQPERFSPLWVHVLAAGVTLIVGFLLFVVRIMGAGDTKLASSLVLWIGAKGLVSFVFFMAIWGGLLGVAALGLKKFKPFKNPRPGGWVEKVQSGHNAVPYGVAVSFGAIVSFWQTGLIQAVSTIY